MKKKLLIFGIKDFAELAWYYFTNDSEYEVAAFVLSKEYMPECREFHALPIVAFEDIENKYSIDKYEFFVPMAPLKMNLIRENIYKKVKEKGYRLPSYISSQANIWNEFNIGENCFILEGSVIQPFVKIGDNTVIWNAHIGHHSVIENNVFIAKSILCGHVTVEDNSFVGAGATIAENRIIKKGTFIAMNSGVIMDTVEWRSYAGNPAMLQKKSSLEML